MTHYVRAFVFCVGGSLFLHLAGCAQRSWQKPAQAWLEEGPLSESSEVEDSFKTARNWRWPLDEVKVTSPFGKRGRRFHYGVDLRAPVGTPVKSIGDGRIVFVGNRVGGFGKLVVVEHGPMLFSLYAHQSKFVVKQGALVKQGQVISYSGKTGRTKGPHLHFEIRQGAFAKSVNPSLVLPPTRKWAGR